MTKYQWYRFPFIEDGMTPIWVATLLITAVIVIVAVIKYSGL